MLFSRQISTRNIKKIKSGVINFVPRRNFKKTFEYLFFYEHLNIEEIDECIRLLNKFRWLKMGVMLTFLAINF